MNSVSNVQVLLESAISSLAVTTRPTRPDIDSFELLVASQLLKPYDLGVDELEAGIVGGGADGGIDGIYVFVDGDPLEPSVSHRLLTRDAVVTLAIFQAKNSGSFSGAALDKLVGSTPRYSIFRAP